MFAISEKELTLSMLNGMHKIKTIEARLLYVVPFLKQKYIEGLYYFLMVTSTS